MRKLNIENEIQILVCKHKANIDLRFRSGE
jgi:hypothetical protein